MIVLDATYLVVLLNSDPPIAMDRNNQPVPHFKERVATLITTLNASGHILGIPAPALAEVLVRAGAQRSLFINILNDRYKFQILPFGSRAAIEASELIEKIKAETKGQRAETWAKVKFDIQIVAIAKAESATIIYADDRGIEANGKRLGIKVQRICDLPYDPSEETELIITSSSVSTGQLGLALTPVEKPEVKISMEGNVGSDKKAEPKVETTPQTSSHASDFLVAKNKESNSSQNLATDESMIPDSSVDEIAVLNSRLADEDTAPVVPRKK